MTGEMIRFLVHLAMNDEHCAWVMDSLPGHVTMPCARSRDSGLEIIPVLRGLTVKYQRLDRARFGLLKMISQCLRDR
jgi:hypothetical protein